MISMVEYSIIAAISKNHVIGDGAKIPWYIPEDFKLFKKATINNIVIMGRATWESLPEKIQTSSKQNKHYFNKGFKLQSRRRNCMFKY